MVSEVFVCTQLWLTRRWRIERGTAYYIDSSEPFSEPPMMYRLYFTTAWLRLCFMTLAGTDPFEQHQPTSYTVDIMGGIMGALETNVPRSVADDEIDYLVASFEGLERNPTDAELMLHRLTLIVPSQNLMLAGHWTAKISQ